MTAPRSKGGLSLYDNLADPADTAATISSAPVSYIQNDGSIPEVAAASTTAKKPTDPSLRFQPIRRPQAKQVNKPKGFVAKATIPKPPPAGVVPQDAANAAPTPVAVKSKLADWAATEEDEWRYGTGEKRQRGGRRKNKKKREETLETDWDELYDPARPTNVEEYLRSDEKISEVREWKTLLYRHRKQYDESDISDDDEDEQPTFSNQFAPPPSYNSFAPPPISPPAAQHDDKPSDDSHLAPVQTQPEPASSPKAPTPPTFSNSATISRAPVRYTQASEPDNDQKDEEMEDHTGIPHAEADDAPRSNRPGQAGFAARLMSKYGWTEGTGLGANESGIVNPLRVQVEKRRKKADADGGGWAEPGSKGRIIGGNRDRKNNESKFGTMSEVIVLQNMLENMADLQTEIADGLGQEIGEECGDKYGRVERLYIDQGNRQVFIKFTDQVSALRAVNELDGRIFNGNAIVAKFYVTEKFERGLYK